jgi:hypothetical protein
MEPRVISSQLSRLGIDLDGAVDLLCSLEEIAVDAEGDYRSAHARAFLGGTGSIEDRKQQAVLAADGHLRVWGKAKAAVTRQKEHIKALHARIDVGRTLASTVRAEVSLARSGLTP